MEESWVPVRSPPVAARPARPSFRDVASLQVNVGDNNSLPFLQTEPGPGLGGEEEPVQVIVFRVVFALMISLSLVLNLLLILAILRVRCRVSCVYILISFLALPDLLFYICLVTELLHWNEADPAWAASQSGCALWQFATHLYPLGYSALLVALVHHSFIALFLDQRGSYERGAKRGLPLLLLGLTFLLSVLCAPSAFYSTVRTTAGGGVGAAGQRCDLEVPAITGAEGEQVQEAAKVAYRLAYELVLPYLAPLLLLAAPYVSLLVGTVRTVEAAQQASYNTKISVVVTLWVLTTFLMLQVPTVIRNVFSIFSVWHRLTALFDAVDDPRVPIFQTYIHVAANLLTVLWAIIRPAVAFRHSTRLRSSLCK